MLNPTQQHLLDTFFGENGDYFQVIQEDLSFNVGTKILYLQRALTENSICFFKLLDKLYAENLSETDKALRLDFIRALKLIHDLYLNNDLKFSEFGLRKAFNHYFAAYGAINHEKFKSIFKTCICARIKQLKHAHSSLGLEAELHERVAKELTILRYSGWRKELDLPVAHVIPQELIDVVTDEEFIEIAAEKRQIMLNHATFLRTLIVDSKIKFTEINNLNFFGLKEFLGNPAVIDILTQELSIGLGDVLALNQDLRTLIFKNINSFKIMVSQLNFSFTKFIALNDRERAFYLKNAKNLNILVNGANISIPEILALNDSFMAFVLNNSNIVRIFINEFQISFKEIVELSLENLTLLMENFVDIQILVKILHIPLLELLSYELTKRDYLIENAYPISILVVKAGISLENLFSYPMYLRNLLVKHHIEFGKLLGDAHLPLQQILALDEEILELVLTHCVAIKTLVLKTNLNFSTILSFDPVNLLFLLKRADDIKILVKDIQLSLDYIFSLDKDYRMLIVDNALLIRLFLKEFSMNADKFFKLKHEVISSILKNIRALGVLVKDLDIPFNDIIALNTLKRELIFANYEIVQNLISNSDERVSYDDLFALSSEELSMVLLNPSSDEAHEILYPTITSCLPM